jgi:hypothetical protein
MNKFENLEIKKIENQEWEKALIRILIFRSLLD